MSVSRRGFLRHSAAMMGGLGMASVVSTEASAKVAKNLVAYQDTPKGDQQCSNCKLFEPPNGCKSVDGPIAANGWCRLWLKA